MGRMTSRLPDLSPSAAVGSLGASELLFTTLSPSRIGEVVGTAAESNAVGTLLASISLVGTELELVANLAGILFFGYAVYEFLPRVFPEELAVVADRRGYRLLAAGFVVTASDTVSSVLLRGGGASSRSASTALGVGAIPLVICVGYVGVIATRDVVDLGPAAHAVSERLDVTGASEESDATGTASFRDRLSDVVSVGVMTAAPLPFLAMAVAVAGLLYPVPEGLAVGWGIIGAVDSRFDRGVGERLPNRERTDLEGSAFDLVVNAVRSTKGIPTVALTLTGLGGAVVIVGVLNSNTPRFAREGLTAVRSDPLFAWSVLGMVLVLLGSGLFAVWFWARVIRRVPAYLRAWNTSNAEASPLADEALPEPVTRPVGLLLPFAVTILPAAAFTQTLRFDYFFGSRTAVLTGYGIVWPLSLAVLGWAVRRTRRTEPQPPSSDSRALPIALTVEWTVFVLLQPIVLFVGRASGIRFPPRMEGTGLLLIIIAMVMFIFVYPDLEASANDAEGWRSQQATLAMFGAGVACAVGGLLNIGDSGLVLGVVAVLFVGGSTWDVVMGKLR